MLGASFGFRREERREEGGREETRASSERGVLLFVCVCVHVCVC